MQVNLFIYRQGRDRPRVTTHMTATVSTCNITSEKMHSVNLCTVHVQLSVHTGNAKQQQLKRRGQTKELSNDINKARRRREKN